MRAALALAEKCLFLTAPNPRVGCVLTNDAGETLGSGHTQQAGGPHAEIMALREAQAHGHNTAGATAWVTLEPCSHQGRTGPCCDALIAAGIKKVVASIEDPNPQVAGQGFARLRAVGIDVQVGPGAAESRALNIGFFSRMQRGRPWVRMKIAASLDGQTALHNGASQWITSSAARADGHAWRARACAVLTGFGTVRDDNPRLDVRDVQTPRQPQLIVVDSRLETPPQAALFQPQRAVAFYAAQPDTARAPALTARGADIRYFPQPAEGGRSKVDLMAMLQDLGGREINELHVEAGHRLNGSLIRAGRVDEYLIYLAPKMLGDGRPMAKLGPLPSLVDAVELAFTEVRLIGPDLRIRARSPGADVF